MKILLTTVSGVGELINKNNDIREVGSFGGKS